jgi:hypothetical protein
MNKCHNRDADAGYALLNRKTQETSVIGIMHAC